MECDNKSNAHNMITISDGDTAMRVICTECKHQYFIRKDRIKGTPEKRIYAKLFKKDILQGGDNLFYKYHPEHLKQ
jgi:hypothetical protein